MVTINKISAEFDDDSFKLIAIHCGLEGYAMAYHINNFVSLKLSRRVENKKKDEDEHDVLDTFLTYEYSDEINDQYWILIENTIKEEKTNQALGLFSNEIAVNTYHLIEEWKEVDYFLKIEVEEDFLINDVVKKINMIPKVVTAYSIEVSALKSKRNLIF